MDRAVHAYDGRDVSPERPMAGHLEPDISGTPSKNKKRRSWLGSSRSRTGVVEYDKESKGRRRKCHVIAACICFLIAAAALVFGVLLLTKQISVDLFTQTTGRGTNVNATLCQQGWNTVLFNDDPSELPCTNLDQEPNCATTVNCCWNGESCETYNKGRECSSITSPSECESQSFCTWRSALSSCRRANKNLENQALANFDECSLGWDLPMNREFAKCYELVDWGSCSSQFGCCWGLQKQFRCTPVFGTKECVERSTEDECEGNIPGRPKVCIWTGTECLKGDPTGRVTRYPTMNEPTKTPTKPTESPTSRPTTKSPTEKPTKVPPTTHPTTGSPTQETGSPTIMLTAPPERRKTSFLIMLADDLGWGDVTYDHPSDIYETININSMARGQHSVKMTRFHSPSVTCSPTRASILSGRNNVRDCVWGANSRWDRRNVKFRPEFPFQGDIEQTLGYIARDRGWKTAFLGKFHVDHPSVLGEWGFDHWVATGGNLPTYDSTCFCNAKKKSVCFTGHYLSQKKINCGCEVLDSDGLEHSLRSQTSAGHFVSQFENFVRGLQPEDSFFAILAFNEPHAPFIASPSIRQNLLKSGKITKQMNKWSLVADYVGAILAMDQAVGRARAVLAEQGRTQDTFVLFTSDNGPEVVNKGGWGSTGGLEGRKRSLFEGGHRVPGILEWPQAIQRNTISSRLISTLDVSATILEIILQDDVNTYLELKDSLDGESLLDALLTDSIISFTRRNPIYMCSTTPIGARQACPSLAVMVEPSLKLVVNVKSDNTLNRPSALLYDYEQSEVKSLPNEHPRYHELLTQAAQFAKTIVSDAAKRCKFPVIQQKKKKKKIRTKKKTKKKKNGRL